MRARILSHHGRQAWVVDTQGAERLCVFKGRDHQPATNDQVEMDPGPSPAVITEILPRQNAVMRSEAHRTKVLAANIDQAVIVISGSPLFSDELLARMYAVFRLKLDCSPRLASWQRPLARWVLDGGYQILKLGQRVVRRPRRHAA